ncbi:MAG: hypothetical protein ACRC4P_04180 [Aeromonas sp.]
MVSAAVVQPSRGPPELIWQGVALKGWQSGGHSRIMSGQRIGSAQMHPV